MNHPVLNQEPLDFELRIQLTPLERNRVRSKEVCEVSSQRNFFIAISIVASAMAAFFVFQLHDGIAAFVWGLVMFIFVPLVMWYLFFSTTKALGGAGMAEVISASVVEEVYRVEKGVLLQESNDAVRVHRFDLDSLLQCEMVNGELMLRFPHTMITIPAGSADRQDLERFSQLLEDYMNS